jgi:SAM-dependent methyltransferase
MSRTVLSPLTQKPAKLIQEIDFDYIKNIYFQNYGLNLLTDDNSIKQIEIWECKQTGYQFYFPFNLSGDSKFYEFFEKFPWYYMPWKWEHKITDEIIEKLDSKNILEVGCASGAFLEYLRKKYKNSTLVGLELNSEAALKATSKGLNVELELVENFANSNKDKFDIVCSFQVLEHISDPFSFLQSSIDCLKKGGKLIICVPNNDSFIKYEKKEPLNYPPHHMGLWTDSSLKSLTTIFNLRLNNIYFENVQDYHFEWYVQVFINRKLGHNFTSRVIFKFLKLSKMLMLLRPYISEMKGHSVLIELEKQ